MSNTSITRITSISGIACITLSMIVLAGCAQHRQHPQHPERLTYEQACARSGGMVWNGECIARDEAETRLRRLQERWVW